MFKCYLSCQESRDEQNWECNQETENHTIDCTSLKQIPTKQLLKSSN